MENGVESPSWMNKEFFATVIRHHSSDVNANITDIVIKPSLTPGEHFVSTMFRVEIKFSTTLQAGNSLSVVIKIPPWHGIEAEFTESSAVFVNEQDMYSWPLVDIKNLLESVGDFCHLSPKLIYQTTKPCRIIVMEDLGAAGYHKITQPLEDFEDSKMVFQRLAKYHAASFFLIHEKKADFRRFNFSIFHLDDPIVRGKFLLESIDAFTDVLESWGDYEEYVKKIKIFRDNFIENGKRLYEPDVDGYNVLNHGDFHIKNLLFKKDGENKIEDFYLMDFQICVLANPCVDLYYALYNEISDENRRTRRDEIIHYYHSEFFAALRRFGYIGKIPTLLDLQMALTKHGQMEVVKCIVFKLFFWIDAADTQNNEIMSSPNSKELKKKIFNDERYRNFAKQELPRLAKMGFL